MEVRFHPEARRELLALPVREQRAALNAVAKLQELGEAIPFPHASRVRAAANLWELRPRAGRSPWRGLYRRIGDAMVIGAFGPEAAVDPTGFRHAVRVAEARLEAAEEMWRDEVGRSGNRG